MTAIKNKLGVHAFVWEHGWSKEQATRAINQSAEAGFDFTGADCVGWMRDAGFRETRAEPLLGSTGMVVGIK